MRGLGLRRRHLAVCALLCFVVAAVGCSGSGGTFPLSISGTWVWTVMGTPCAGFTGVLAGSASFSVQQDGVDISGQFTDGDGNLVSITGRYVNGVFTGVLKVLFPNGRGICANLVLHGDELPSGQATLDGDYKVTADTDSACIGASLIVWVDIGVPVPGDIGDIIRQCDRPVDVVVVMDTSGSMTDEADALCAFLEQLQAELQSRNLAGLLQVTRLGVTEDADDDSDFPCLTNNVCDLFGNAIVPGTDGERLEDTEDWSSGAAMVAALFGWRSNAIRIVVTISDEDPQDGNGEDVDDGEPDSPPSFCDIEDEASVRNAIRQACANDVILSPIITFNSETQSISGGCVLDLAQMMAGSTGGVCIEIDEAVTGLDRIEEAVEEIIFEACFGVIRQQCPLPDLLPQDPMMLITAGRNGGIYAVDESTGELRLIGTPQTTTLGEQQVPITHTSSLLYNRTTNELWAGTGAQFQECNACVFLIDNTNVNNVATQLADNSFTAVGLSGMAQRPYGAIYATPGSEGNNELLGLFNTGADAGEAGEFDSFDDISLSRGNGITFVDSTLYLASGDTLYAVNSGNADTKAVGDFTFSGFDPVPTEYAINSMATRPRDNAVFGILRDKTASAVHLVQIDIAQGTVTNAGMTLNQNQDLVEVDGLTFVPADFLSAPATPCPIDLVFLVDTSSSNVNNGSILCSMVDQVEADVVGTFQAAAADLAAQGIEVNINVAKLGITNDGGTDFPCLTESVASRFGTTVPGGVMDMLDNGGDWGGALAIVADSFPWQDGGLRIIIVVTNSEPQNPTDTGTPTLDTEDFLALENAFGFLIGNNVVVGGIVGLGMPSDAESALRSLISFGTISSVFPNAGFMMGDEPVVGQGQNSTEAAAAAAALSQDIVTGWELSCPDFVGD